MKKIAWCALIGLAGCASAIIYDKPKYRAEPDGKTYVTIGGRVIGTCEGDCVGGSGRQTVTARVATRHVEVMRIVRQGTFQSGWLHGKGRETMILYESGRAWHVEGEFWQGCPVQGLISYHERSESQQGQLSSLRQNKPEPEGPIYTANTRLEFARNPNMTWCKDFVEKRNSPTLENMSLTVPANIKIIDTDAYPVAREEIFRDRTLQPFYYAIDYQNLWSAAELENKKMVEEEAKIYKNAFLNLENGRAFISTQDVPVARPGDLIEFEKIEWEREPEKEFKNQLKAQKTERIAREKAEKEANREYLAAEQQRLREERAARNSASQGSGCSVTQCATFYEKGYDRKSCVKTMIWAGGADQQACIAFCKECFPDF